MKKVLLWTLYILALAATVLCFVFPVQAKETCENVINVLNTPFVIAGVSVTLGGLLTFIVSKFILNNTKFGRKEIDNLKAENEEFKKIIIENEKSVNEKVDNCEKQVNKLEESCNNQCTIMLGQFESLQTNVINALKAIPNKKIQAIVEEYESHYEAEKQEIIEKTINTNEYVDKKLEEMFDEFMKKVEDTLNEERKEAINTETEAA